MNMTPTLWDTTVGKGARYWSIAVSKLHKVLDDKPETGIALRDNFAMSDKNCITTILEELERTAAPEAPPSSPRSISIDEEVETTRPRADWHEMLDDLTGRDSVRLPDAACAVRSKGVTTLAPAVAGRDLTEGTT